MTPREFRKDDDARWQFGLPPRGNTNFAWVQHFIHHLALFFSWNKRMPRGQFTGGDRQRIMRVQQSVLQARLSE